MLGFPIEALAVRSGAERCAGCTGSDLRYQTIVGAGSLSIPFAVISRALKVCHSDHLPVISCTSFFLVIQANGADLQRIVTDNALQSGLSLTREG